MSIGRIVVALALVASLGLAQFPHFPSFGRGNIVRQVQKETLRVATYNLSLNRGNAGDLINDLSTPNDAQAQAVAEIIQRTRPDVLLINEFDFDQNGVAAQLFQQNYLSVSQNGADPIVYPHVFLAPSNTGVPSGMDLDNDGSTTGPGDAFGFGFFPGQFGMLVLSKHNIRENKVRTFQNFLWKDMPGALLPDDPSTPTPADYYSQAELNVFRLSSKSHWDVPIRFRGETIHLLCAHPTPPVFDGPEDRNGRRNHDEIRFWADYVTPGAGGYIYDDKGDTGGLAQGEKFVIAGDYNADPNDGDSVPGAIQQLLGNARINGAVAPVSGGALEADAQGGANAAHVSNPMADTADFNDNPAPGNLRVDYVLPSNNLPLIASGVFWPQSADPLSSLTGTFPFPSSDHRLVWIDVRVGDMVLEYLGEATFPTGFMFQGTEVGGLSGLDYIPFFRRYVAISDDRSSINPARTYELKIDLSDGSLDQGDVTIVGTTTLLQNDGTPYPMNSLDPEGIAIAPFTGATFVCSEGDANAGIDPFVDRFKFSGRQVEALEVPSKFNTGTPGSGIRNNLAFESLTLTPWGRKLFTATENALEQDGPTASLIGGSACRVLRLDRFSGDAEKEWVYVTDALPFGSNPSGSFATHGLVELLCLGGNGSRSTNFVALERSFAVGVGNDVRLYATDFRGATNVRNIPSLASPNGTVKTARKALLLDLRTLGITLDNLEGLAIGPFLPDGRRVLIVVSDNNFNPNGQFTQFLAFALPFGV